MRPISNIILKTVLVTLSFTTSAKCQDYHKLGKDYLSKVSGNPELFEKNFKFNKEYNIRKLVILESDEPECFVMFIKKNNAPAIIAHSPDKKFNNKNAALIENDEFLKKLSNLSARDFNLKTSIGKNRIPVGPLLSTQWDQNRWYNSYCPYNIKSNAGEHDLTGCIATGMGQIIKYYGKWNKFVINKSHNIRGQVMVSSSGDYKYEEMIDVPLNYDLEIGRLLADLGILVDMRYGPDFSSQAFGFARKKGFLKIGYDSASPGWRNQQDDWLDRLYSDLENYHPVLVGGGNHAFICDGFDENGMLHFNLGYGGLYDGYYHPSCVTALKYYCDESVFNAYPSGYSDYPSPRAIRQVNGPGSSTVAWLPPKDAENILGYNVYYSDIEYITVTDTLVDIRDFEPGYHEVMVSAVYPLGESIWIGPVRIFNPGENALLIDAAMTEAIRTSLESLPDLLCTDIISQGDLNRIRILKVKEAVRDVEVIKSMTNLQDLSINAVDLDILSSDMFSPLPRLQNLEICNYNGHLPDLSHLKKLKRISLVSCNIPDIQVLTSLSNLMELELYNCIIEDGLIPSEMTSLVHMTVVNTKINNTFFLNYFRDLRKLQLKNCKLQEIKLIVELRKLVCIDLSDNSISNTDFIDMMPNLKSIVLSNNDIEFVHFKREHQHLIKLDLSFNKIIHLNDLVNHKSISMLHLQGNLVSDISPIIENFDISSMDQLNITRNPLSKQSFDSYVSRLKHEINYAEFPSTFESGSPCFPEIRIEPNNGKKTNEISWYCEDMNPNKRFQIYIREGKELKLLKESIVDSYTTLDGEYTDSTYWVVKTVYPDTSFYSGLYEFDQEVQRKSSLASAIQNMDIKVSAFPNPASDFVRFSGVSNTPVSINLVSANGQLVMREEVRPTSGSVQIDIRDLSQGVYIYKISSMNSDLGSGRLVIKR